MTRRALVIGGTGHLGRAVLACLRDRGVEASFSWHEDVAGAATLEALGHSGARVELRDPASILALAALDPDVLVWCAAPRGLPADPVAAWEAAVAVGARGPALLVDALAPGWAARGGGSAVIATGGAALHGLRIDPAAAGAQGAAAAVARALAKRHGAAGTRVSALAIGLLDGGQADLVDPMLKAEYARYAPLGRPVTAAGAARVALWLALDATWVSGAVFPLAGGL